MRFPLVRKELREQRPFLLLGVVLLALDVLSLVVLQGPDLRPLATTFTPQEEEGVRILLFFLSFALATGLLMRERDEGTLEFLDALPLSRSRMFLVKVSVALPVLMVYPVGVAGLRLAQHLASRTSLDRGMHLGLLGAGLALTAAMLLCVFALGLLLSHLRGLSWLVLGVLALGLLVLEDRVPALDMLNPFALTRPDFVGSAWRVPWSALRLQLLLAAAHLLTALALYAGWGQRPLAAVAQRLEGRFSRWLVRVSTVGVAIACLAIFARRSSPGEVGGDGETPKVAYPQATVTQAATEHYRFLYPSPQRLQASALLDGADGTFEAVRRLLDAPADGAPIQADLSGSARHTAGTAHWEALRMGLADGPERVRGTLAHETAHVLAMRLVGAAAHSRLQDMRLLNEGLATYVEHRVVPRPEERERLLFVAAAMHARGEVHLEELLEPEQLARTRDTNLVYPLGSLLVEALVSRYGDAATGRVLRAIGRPEAPESLSPPERWHDAFSAAGVDLPRVVDDLFTRLERLAKERAAALAALPRPRGALTQDAKWAWVHPRLDGPLPEGWHVVCRFRAREDSPLSEYDGPYLHEGTLEEAIFSRHRSRMVGRRLWFQLGLRAPGGHILYEPWTSVPLEG